MLPDGLQFQHPHALWLLALIPLLLWSAWEARRRRAVLKFPLAHVLARRGRGVRAAMVPLLPLIQSAAVLFLVVALARPQERGARIRDFTVEGIDIVIALDLSTSMEAADFRPSNRLHVAKEVLQEFISKRVNDRIGLVVFAGVAYTQAPLTLDYRVLQEVVNQLRTRVLEDGTAIGDALATSLNRLRDSEAESRVVVLITDGDNNSGRISPMDAAKMAEALGIPIYTILVGKGGKVPFPSGQDLFGNAVYSMVELPVNPELLEDISRLTGGEYYRATDRESLEQGLQRVLDRLEKSELLEGGAAANVREAFAPFLLMGLFFALLELLVRIGLLRIFP